MLVGGVYRRDFKLFYILGDFSIDAGTGVIRTVNKLERDLGYQYNLTIKATDHGSPALSATVSYRDQFRTDRTIQYR